MTINIQATYKAGAIYPDHPLDLPENTPVQVVINPQPDTSKMTREEIIAIRPKSPKFTSEQLDALLAKHSVSVGSLPTDFSRADIYSEHD